MTVYETDESHIQYLNWPQSFTRETFSAFISWDWTKLRALDLSSTRFDGWMLSMMAHASWVNLRILDLRGNPLLHFWRYQTSYAANAPAWYENTWGPFLEGTFNKLELLRIEPDSNLETLLPKNVQVHTAYWEYSLQYRFGQWFGQWRNPDVIKAYFDRSLLNEEMEPPGATPRHQGQPSQGERLYDSMKGSVYGPNVSYSMPFSFDKSLGDDRRVDMPLLKAKQQAFHTLRRAVAELRADERIVCLMQVCKTYELNVDSLRCVVQKLRELYYVDMKNELDKFEAISFLCVVRH